MNNAAKSVLTTAILVAIAISSFVISPCNLDGASTTFETDLRALNTNFKFESADNIIKKYIDRDCTNAFCAGLNWPGQKITGMFLSYFTLIKSRDYNFASCTLLDLKTLRNASNPKSKYFIFFYFKDEQGQKKTFSYKLAGVKLGLGFFACLKLPQRQALLKLIKDYPERILGTSLIEELNGKTVYYDCSFLGNLCYKEMFSQFGLAGNHFPRSQQDLDNFYFDLVYMGTPKVSQGSVGLEFACEANQTRLVTFFDGRADYLWAPLKAEISKAYIAKNLGTDFTQIDVSLFVADGQGTGTSLPLGKLESLCEWFFVNIFNPNYSEVKDLTDQFFATKVEKISGLALVDFYGPDCQPCDKLLPHLQRLAVQQSVVKIFRMDATKNPQTSKKYSVTGWPHLILFENGKPIDERIGYRTYDELKAFIKYDDFVPPPPLAEKDDSNFADSVAKSKIFYLAFFYDDCDNCAAMIKELEKINQKTSYAEIVQIKIADNPKTCSRYKVTKAPCLILFLDGKEVTRRTDFLNYAQIKELLKNNGCKT